MDGNCMCFPFEIIDVESDAKTILKRIEFGLSYFLFVVAFHTQNAMVCGGNGKVTGMFNAHFLFAAAVKDANILGIAVTHIHEMTTKHFAPINETDSL